MTTITSPNPQPLYTTPSQSTQAAGAKTTLSSDFETFLKMLTVQMQNQDPLNPIESSEYAMQLATFSSVEQQVLTNDLLTALSAQMTSTGLGQLSGWIGQEALANTPVAFDGRPVDLQIDPASGADLVRLVVRDSNGSIVQEVDAPNTAGPVSWAGVDDQGAPMPEGTYSFEIVSFSGQDVLDTKPALAYVPIVETRLMDGATHLITQGGQMVAASDISGLRAP